MSRNRNRGNAHLAAAIASVSTVSAVPTTAVGRGHLASVPPADVGTARADADTLAAVSASATPPPPTRAPADGAPFGRLGPRRRAGRRGGRRAMWRRLSVLLMIAAFLTLSQPAYAAPVTTTTVPDDLKKYVAGTSQWDNSPWMTAPGCAQFGGDFSVFTQNVMADTPALLQFFQPDFGGDDSAAPARGAEIIAGYKEIASQLTVPAGYCVDTVKKWATPDPSFQPFGFDWGDSADPTHNAGFVCANNVGADNAPCGGFYVACIGAATVSMQSLAACQQWDRFSDGYVQAVSTMRNKADADHPGGAQGGTQNKVKSPGQILQGILDWGVQTGMQQVVGFAVDGMIKGWALFLQVAVNFTEPDVGGAGFGDVYSLLGGVCLALAFLGWLFSLITSWRKGRLMASLLGAPKAIAAVTLAGVGAILMVQLATECTRTLIIASGNLGQQADWTDALTAVNPLIALVVCAVAIICLIFAILLLVVHAPLVLMWALMGSVAAAGQIHEASSQWLWKWASRLTALAWVPFVMIGEMDLSFALIQPSPGVDGITQIRDIVQGLLLSVVLVLTPFLLWELIDFVGDRIGGAQASGGPATAAAAAGGRGAAAKAGGSGRSAATRAVSGLMAAAADVPRQIREGWQQGMRPEGDTASSAANNSGSAGSGDEPSGKRNWSLGNLGAVLASPFTGGDSGAAGSDTGTAAGGTPGGAGGGGDTVPAANRGTVVAGAPRRPPPPPPPRRPPSDGPGFGPPPVPPS